MPTKHLFKIISLFLSYLYSASAEAVPKREENMALVIGNLQVDGNLTGAQTTVRVATTANGTLASDFENTDTVDGVTLATGDRILLKDQSTASENGIYIVEASGAPTRAADMPTGDSANSVHTWVAEGTANAGTAWICTSAVGSDDVGTDNLTFTQYDVVADLAVARGGTGVSTLTSGNVLVGAGTSAVTTTKAAPTGDFVGTSDTQTLTNKTIDASNNTISNIDLTSDITGTLPVANGGTGATTLTSNALLTGNGTSAIVAESNLTFDGSDLAHIEAVNDGNPSYVIGSATAESLLIQANYAAGTQDLESVAFTTRTASATADRGSMTFSIDDDLTMTLDDGGLNLATGHQFEINGTAVLTSSTLGSGVTSSSLTSVGTITSGTWNGDTITVANGGTGATTLTSGNVLVGNGTGVVTTSQAAPSGDFVGTTDTQTLTNKTLTSPDINGGTADSLTALSIQDVGTSNDLTLVSNSDANLTAGRSLTFDVEDADRTIKMGGNITLDNSFTTSGDFALTLTQTASTNVTLPTSGTLANQAYVDSVVQGLDVKNSCRLASDQNSNWTSSATITFSDPTLTISNLSTGTSRGLIDTVEPVDGNRILIKDAGSASGGAAASDVYNGLWEVTGGSTTSLTLTRTTDADADSEVTAGLFTFVEEGAVNADNGFVITTDDPITVDTTAIVFAQFSGAGQITAGDGLDKSGNTLSVDLKANGGLVIESTEIAVDLGASSITGTLAVSDGGTGATTLTSNAILTGNGTSAVQAEGNLLFDGSDLTHLEAVNDGNPSYVLGSTSAESLLIQSSYASGTQDLETVAFTTRTASGTADRGSMTFSVDEDLTMTLDDGGLNLATGKQFEINGTAVLTSSTLGSGVTSSSLTSVGTITSGTWNGTTIAVADGGTGATSLTSNALLTGNGTSAIQAEGNLLFDGSDLTHLEAVNDGNPSYVLGSAAAESLLVQSSYASGTQDLETVAFTTRTASATADRGSMTFSVDESLTMTLNDAGILVGSSKELRFNDSDASDYVGLDVPSAVTTYTLTLPAANGSSGQVLRLADGSGNLEFASVGTVRNNYVLMSSQISASATSLTAVAYFAWDQSEYSSYSAGTVVFWHADVDNRDLTVELFDPGVAESSTVTSPAGSAYTSTGAGDYFRIRSAGDATTYYVWFDVSGGNTDPAPGGTGIEVDITAADSATTVAAAIQTAVNANSDFSAIQNGADVMITNAAIGTATDIEGATFVSAAGGTVAVDDQGAATAVVATTTISSPAVDGIATMSMTNPTDDRVLQLRVAKSANGGTNPQIFGVQMELTS